MSADPIMLSVNGVDSGHLNMETSTAGALQNQHSVTGGSMGKQHSFKHYHYCVTTTCPKTVLFFFTCLVRCPISDPT